MQLFAAKNTQTMMLDNITFQWKNEGTNYMKTNLLVLQHYPPDGTNGELLSSSLSIQKLPPLVK